MPQIIESIFATEQDCPAVLSKWKCYRHNEYNMFINYMGGGAFPQFSGEISGKWRTVSHLLTWEKY